MESGNGSELDLEVEIERLDATLLLRGADRGLSQELSCVIDIAAHHDVQQAVTFALDLE